MSHSDTHPDAARIRSEILRNMSGEQRVKLVFQMSNFMRKMAISRIRSEHPDWTESQVKRELLRLSFLPDPLPAGFR